MQTVFEIWRHWIEGQKGTAAEALLARPETIPGFAPSSVLLRFVKSNDFGPYLTGEIRAYCPRADPPGDVASNCQYRLRRAFVPQDAADFADPANAVAQWTRQTFDAPRLAAQLSAAGFAPQTDWWRADPVRMFAGMPSPIQVLMQNAAVVRLDSTQCPAMGEAIARLDRTHLAGRLDLRDVGEDTPVSLPAPHAIRGSYELNVILPGGEATIAGEGLREVVAPILDAADRCERDLGISYPE